MQLINLDLIIWAAYMYFIMYIYFLYIVDDGVVPYAKYSMRQSQVLYNLLNVFC